MCYAKDHIKNKLIRLNFILFSISAFTSVLRLFESPQREEMHMKDNTKTKLHTINNKILR
jgi:hypothetical protein